MIGLGDLPGGAFSSFAIDASGDGSVIVGGSLTADGSAAFYWDAADGMQRLDEVLTDLGLDLTGWTLSTARGISDDGLTIAGTGRNPDGFPEAWVAYLPEATPSLLLWAAALAGAIVRRWL